MKAVWMLIFSVFSLSMAASQDVLVAAASDLVYAFKEISAAFEESHPGVRIRTTFGSSGNFHAQILNGAPYHLFFSADTALPLELKRRGLADGEVVPYARGRIVLWWPGKRKVPLTLEALAAQEISRIALANPKHAPYGQRGKEALVSRGLWKSVENKIVFGENISQTAQFVLTGNAQAGLIALSLALSGPMVDKGEYFLIPESLHAPLDQGFILLRSGENLPEARAFSAFMSGSQARDIMTGYGFILPPEGPP